MTGKRLCKGLRHCAILEKTVSCSGLCRVVYGHVDANLEERLLVKAGIDQPSRDQMIMCPVYEEAWDRIVNQGGRF
jgi:hypothetical protein